MRKRTPESVAAKIVAARELGASTGNIANHFGLTAQGVRQILRRACGSLHPAVRQATRDDLPLLLAGLMQPKASRSACRTPEIVEQAIVDQYCAGVKPAALVEKYGVGKRTVYNILSRASGR